MNQTPPVLTADGDIRIHNREGARIPLFFETEDGTPRDMRTATVRFTTETGVQKVLSAGVADNELVLTLAPLDFQASLGKMIDFIVQDESVPEKPVIWTGRVFVGGW